MRSDPLNRLHVTIAQEKSALLQGDYAALEQLQADKLRHILALENDPPSQQDLRVLRQVMDANQTLMEAALRGVQTAKDRLAALQRVQAGLTTYEQDGRLANRQTAAARVEKKA